MHSILRWNGAVAIAVFFGAVIILGGVGGCGGSGSSGPASEKILSTSPLPNATGVAVTSTIQIVFDADLDETTLIPANVTLMRNGTIPVSGTISYDAATRTLTFTPTFPLASGAPYTFTMTSAVVTKAAGDYTLAFTTAPTAILYNKVNIDPATGSQTTGVIASITPDGATQTDLTIVATQPYATEAHWSPDDTKIAYYVSSVDLGTTHNLAVMNADGSSKAQLTNFSAAEGTVAWFRWTPDGSAVFYLKDCTTGGAECYELYSIGPEGGTPTKIIAGSTAAFPGAGILFTPDGTKFVYQYAEVTNPGTPSATAKINLRIRNVDGTGDAALTDVAMGQFCSDAVLSLDGTKVYYTIGRIGDHPLPDIYTVNIDGTGERALTQNAIGTSAYDLLPPQDASTIIYTIARSYSGGRRRRRRISTASRSTAPGAPTSQASVPAAPRSSRTGRRMASIFCWRETTRRRLRRCTATKTW